MGFTLRGAAYNVVHEERENKMGARDGHGVTDRLAHRQVASTRMEMLRHEKNPLF